MACGAATMAEFAVGAMATATRSHLDSVSERTTGDFDSCRCSALDGLGETSAGLGETSGAGARPAESGGLGVQADHSRARSSRGALSRGRSRTLAHIHEERERATMAAMAARGTAGSTGSGAGIRRPSTVVFEDKGRFNMLTFKVRWRRNAMMWSTSYFAVGRAVDDETMVLLETHKHSIISLDLDDVADVTRMRRHRCLRFHVPHRTRPGRQVGVVLEFESDSLCDEAYAALTANRTRAAPKSVSVQCVTWNMGNAPPVEEQLLSLVDPSVDLLIVGVQVDTPCPRPCRRFPQPRPQPSPSPTLHLSPSLGPSSVASRPLAAGGLVQNAPWLRVRHRALVQHGGARCIARDAPRSGGIQLHGRDPPARNLPQGARSVHLVNRVELPAYWVG